jgi:hypothetical protein
MLLILHMGDVTLYIGDCIVDIHELIIDSLLESLLVQVKMIYRLCNVLKVVLHTTDLR